MSASQFLPRHFARHRLRIEVSACFDHPPANRLNTKTCLHTVAQTERKSCRTLASANCHKTERFAVLLQIKRELKNQSECLALP